MYVAKIKELGEKDWHWDYLTTEGFVDEDEIDEEDVDEIVGMLELRSGVEWIEDDRRGVEKIVASEAHANCGQDCPLILQAKKFREEHEAMEVTRRAGNVS